MLLLVIPLSLLISGNHWFLKLSPSLCIFWKMSYSCDHTTSSDGSLSFSNMYLSFLHVFLWLNSSFLFTSWILFHCPDVPQLFKLINLVSLGDNYLTIQWWILPYINMNQSQLYLSSPLSWNPSHLLSHPIPLGCPRAPALGPSFMHQTYTSHLFYLR